MSYPKPAFMIEDELSGFSPEQIMVKMFEYTDKEGYLSIPEWPYDNTSPEEQDIYYLCKMNWNSEDLNNVIDDFRKLEERLKTIKEEEPLQSIVRENFDLVPFSEIPMEISDLIVLKEAKRPATYDVAIRAVRLCKLYAMDVPAVIIDNEARLLAQALVVNHFAESVQPFSRFDATAVECMKIINDNVAQDGPLVGIFWYDTEKEELFGVHNSLACNYVGVSSHSIDLELLLTAVTTDRRTHRTIWEKEAKKGKDKRFSGEYESTPRGRVVRIDGLPQDYRHGVAVFTGEWIKKHPDAKEFYESRQDYRYAVFTGKWIKEHPDAKEKILWEFQLPENTEFYDTGDELEVDNAGLTWDEIRYCDTLVRVVFGPANYVIDYSRELLGQIEENVSSLPQDEKDVIEKLFRDRELLELFAASEGIDLEEAEVRKSTALRKLRHPRNSRKLKPFVHYIEEG